MEQVSDICLDIMKSIPRIIERISQTMKGPGKSKRLVGKQTVALTEIDSNRAENIKTWEGIDSYSDLKMCMDIEWEAEIYERTTILESSPITEAETAHILVEPEDENMGSGIQKMYAELYPDLLRMKNEMDCLEVTKVGKGGDREEKTKQILKGEYEGRQDILEANLTKESKTIKDRRKVLLHGIQKVDAIKL